jgi:hypothetical protein
MIRPLRRGGIRAVRSEGTPGGQGAADHPPEPPLQTLRRVHVCHPESWDRLLRKDSRIQPWVQKVPQGTWGHVMIIGLGSPEGGSMGESPFYLLPCLASFSCRGSSVAHVEHRGTGSQSRTPGPFQRILLEKGRSVW